MKKIIIWYGILLIFGQLITEAHSVLYAFYPEVCNRRIDLFWISEPMDIYKDGNGFGLVFQWYIKMICDSINMCIIFFILTNLAYKYSTALFFICSIIFMYNLIDLFLFCYNYKRTAVVYWVLLSATIASIIFLIVKRRIYSYSSMDN